MNNLLSAVLVEVTKARRSKMPLLTFAGFLLIAFVAALFMVILKNPEQAKNLGIVNTKAQLLTSGKVSWKAFLDFFSQASIATMVISSFIAAWVFGREYIDKTLKDLLALPTSRDTIVMAKLILIAIWSFVFSLVAPIIGIALGLLIKLPGWSVQPVIDMLSRWAVVSLLSVVLAFAVALSANIGKSYFPAIAFVIFMVFFAQIAQVLGWGAYFPWAVPGLYANVANPTHLGVISYIIVIVTGLIGVVGTIVWWRYADHT